MDAQGWAHIVGQLAKDLGPCLTILAGIIALQMMLHRDNQIRLAALERLLTLMLDKLSGKEKDNAPN